MDDLWSGLEDILPKNLPQLFDQPLNSSRTTENQKQETQETIRVDNARNSTLSIKRNFENNDNFQQHLPKKRKTFYFDNNETPFVYQLSQISSVKEEQSENHEVKRSPNFLSSTNNQPRRDFPNNLRNNNSNSMSNYGQLKQKSFDFNAKCDLVKVNSLPPALHEIFPFREFNKLQSQVFDKVYNDNNNIVLTAPTGAGKTVIFELGILHSFNHHNHNNQRFHQIYIAPLKAICHERLSDWTSKFSNINLTCVELTGDTDLSPKEIEAANIIVTTPEKLDAWIRKNWDVSFIKAISLIMLDEVQTLGETRGATLEAVISRLKLVRSRSPNSEKLRFIAVSATCPNINEIGDWLNTPQSNVCVFGDEYRPVKLYTQVIGYPCKSSNKFLFHQNLKYRVFDLIMRYYDGKPTLLFCGTRKDTINTSQQILKDIQEKKNPFILNQEQKSKLLIASRTISNQPLKELIIHGIGFYHAGLSYADRNSIQELYISNLLYVICTTSSLAQGVNLPAHLVIIQGTEMYKSGSFEDTSLIDITQMMGRAGRPQFDTSGNVVIMTRDECKKKYENFLSGMEMIESSMMDSIPSFLNSEIVLGTINNIHDSIEWIKSTFLYHRIRSNPSRYGIPSGLTVARLDQILKQLCMKALKDLEEFQMITIRQNDGTLCALNSGKYMAKYYIHFETMKLFTTLTPTTSIQELLTLLSHSGEFSQMSLRRSEKLLLNKLHAQIKYPNKKTEKKLELVKTREDKIYVLIQAILSDEEITDWSLKQEALQIFNILPRIMNGIRSFLSEKKYFISLMNSIFLIQSIQQKIWFDSDQITRQLEKIGKILSQTLSNRGLNSFQKLVEQDPRDLERILNRNPPFGTQLIQSVIKIWPNFEVEIHKEMSINTQKVNNLEVRLRARNAIEKAGKYKNSQNYSSLIVGDVENSLLLYDIKVPHSEVAFQQFKVPIGDSTSIKCYILREDYIGMTTVIDFDAKTSTIIESSDPNNYIQKTEENYPSNTPNDEYRNNNHNYNQSYENSYKYQSINPDDNEIEEDFDDESEDLPNFSVVPEEAISNKITTACKHNCKDKQLCKHECCKSGLKKSPQEKKIDDYYPISKPITRITSNYMNNNSFGVKGNNEAPTPTPTNARHPPDYYNPYSSKINYHYQLNNEQSVNNNYSPNPSSGIDTKNHYPLTNWSAQDNKQSLNHMQTNNNHYTEKPLDYLSAEEDFTKDKNLFQEFVKEYGYVSKDQPKPMTRIVDHNNRLTSNYANSNRQINNAKINSQADINSNKDAQTKEQLEDEIRELKMQLQQIKSNTGTNQLQNQIQTPKPTSVNTHKELSKITHNNNYGNNSSSAKYQSHIMPRPVQSLESQQYNSYPSGTHMANFFPSSETHSLSYEPFSYKSETIVTPAVIKKPQEGSKWYSLAKSFAQNKQNSNN